jgi:Flp pilus assembly protein TadG
MRSGRRNERAQGLLEYALVLPLLLLLVLAVIEFAIVLWSYGTISNAAREGARSGIIYPYDLAAAEAAVRARAVALDQSALGVETDHIDNRIFITTTYTVTLMTGSLVDAVGGDPDLHLAAVATMRIE